MIKSLNLISAEKYSLLKSVNPFNDQVSSMNDILYCVGCVTHTQPFYGSLDFVQDNLGEPVPEEIFTHSHLLWSSIVPYLLHRSNTIHGILPV